VLGLFFGNPLSEPFESMLSRVSWSFFDDIIYQRLYEGVDVSGKIVLNLFLFSLHLNSFRLLIIRAIENKNILINTD